MITDRLLRNFEYLRISVTDKCNYRCSYCMPKDIFDKKHQFLRKGELLSYEEIIEIVKTLRGYGLKKIRLTGGEPLLRKNLELLVEGLKKDAHINEVTLTTNGSLLDMDKIKILKKHGLDKITISLDSLSKKSSDSINPINNDVSKVMQSIENTLAVYGTLKINMVVIKNVNSHEIIKMVNKFIEKNIELRFIEYMDVGESNNWVSEDVFTSQETIDVISKHYHMTKMNDAKDSTSTKWQLDGHPLKIAFISSITKPFCGNCNRGRLSADGKFYTCLFTDSGHDFKNILRDKNNRITLREFFKTVWMNRDDQYSQIRFTSKTFKRKKHKVEMSYIGG
tara:strand:+ start:3064 stop:4074 length:1011 start_codon:yes stop_codon:yes gene_type:complete